MIGMSIHECNSIRDQHDRSTFVYIRQWIWRTGRQGPRAGNCAT